MMRLNRAASVAIATLVLLAQRVIVEPLPESDLVVANIERKLIEMLLQRDGLPNRIIVSGLRIEDTVDHRGWTLVTQHVLDGWRSALLVR